MKSPFHLSSLGALAAPFFVAELLSGCAPAAPPQSATAEEPASPAEPSAEGPPKEEAPPPPQTEVGALPEVVPPAAESCVQGTALPEQKACEDWEISLADALEVKDPAGRDSALAALESCSEHPAGWVRALRAEVGPAECADRLTLPALEGERSAEGPLRSRLIALTWASWLHRLATLPPAPPEDHSKDSLNEYFKTAFFQWIIGQSKAIDELSLRGSKLAGYDRGIVAVEAGLADMRFVELARELPIPDEFKAEPEAVEIYYSELDIALEPRKNRGRDAALVGLNDLLARGVREDRRVKQARALLSKLWGGSRLNALDQLLVPRIAASESETVEARLATHLPSEYTQVVLSTRTLDASAWTALLQHGLPVWAARALSTENTARSHAYLGTARFALGETYFNAAQFQLAEASLSRALDAGTTRKAETAEAEAEGAAPAAAPAVLPLTADDLRHLRVLSIALMAGPRNAAELMAKGARFADAEANFALLDGFSSGDAEVMARATFNATWLKQLVAPLSNPGYWQELAKSYKDAADQLSGDEKKLAQELADDATRTAKDVARDQPKD